MNYRLLLFLLALILLCGCASLTTTSLAPTSTTRNARSMDEITIVRFQTLRRPSATSSNLTITITKRATRKETFQRRYIHKRTLKSDARTVFWLAGLATAAGGYYLYDQTGMVRLGQLVMGGGGLVPITGEIISAGLAPVGEEWKQESRTLPVRTLPAANEDVIATAGSSSWSFQTDNSGLLAVDVSTLVDVVAPGQPLTIEFALKQDPSQDTTITVPASILDAHRPAPPPIAETDIEPPAPPATEVTSLPTIAILDFEGIGVSVQEARVLTNRLGTHMVQLGRYQVIERGQMEQILTEQDFQMTGCTSNECAVEIGQLIGAGQMLAGSFGKLGTVYTIDMRIIDVVTGRILRTTSYDIEGSISRMLTEGLAEATRRIAGMD
ncbi:MAG: DUF2380 domain-containing protein [Fidelibacterota bacterium]|nr:MAG: DUF2380 domain-containing protein [Candidatus Neomarinimicrobiota bacterium]